MIAPGRQLLLPRQSDLQCWLASAIAGPAQAGNKLLVAVELTCHLGYA